VESTGHNKPGGGPFYEVLTAEEVAARWRVPANLGAEQLVAVVPIQSRTFDWAATYVFPLVLPN